MVTPDEVEGLEDEEDYGSDRSIEDDIEQRIEDEAFRSVVKQYIQSS